MTDNNMGLDTGCWKLNFTHDVPMMFLPDQSSFTYTGIVILSQFLSNTCCVLMSHYIKLKLVMPAIHVTINRDDLSNLCMRISFEIIVDRLQLQFPSYIYIYI